MTRSELTAIIAQRLPHFVAKDAEIAVNEILQAIAQTLIRGDRVEIRGFEIRGFGSFSLNYKPPRNGRNPKTGEKVSVSGKHVPHFKAGKELREVVDRSVLAPTQRMVA